MNNELNLTFIGAGRMANAIVKGLLNNGYENKLISAYDISDDALAKFAKNIDIQTTTNLNDITNNDCVILAVKPQNIKSAISANKEFFENKLIISIAAGVKIETLQALTGNNRIIRVMPNTPALVGAGASAYALSKNITKKDAEFAENILNAIGKVYLIDEKLMDVVTGLSGSGPAYVFDFIQGLADGGVKEGLSRDIALQLAAQTTLGAAKMILELNEHPTVLKDQVTSPGGTTAAGLAKLEKKAFRGIVANAVRCKCG